MTDIDPGIRFPGESEEYRRERNRLLQAEAGLRRAIEQVAAQRRALPPGGVVPDDYRFDDVSDSGEVRLLAIQSEEVRRVRRARGRLGDVRGGQL